MNSKLIFFGDLYLKQAYKSDLNLDNADYIANLEYPISSNRNTPALNKVNLIQQESFIDKTFGKNPIAVNLANNHMFDFGDEVFLDTISLLEKNNIKYFGAGNIDNNFNNSCEIRFGNKKIALLGYCCKSTHPSAGKTFSVAMINIENIKNDIDVIKNNVDYIVVSLHYGEEEISFPKPHDIDLSHVLIDYGVDLIIGHHSHCPQPVEHYKGKNIFYGLGNTIFSPLDEPSYYNGKTFQKHFKKKLSKINKQSICAELSLDLTLSKSTMFFDGTKLYNKHFALPTYLPKSQTEFNFLFNKTRQIQKLKSFISNPRIPKLSGIIRFFKKTK
jgi:poly-gamma-glutamate capsule biosynthesis protein CapA/YwtB (metallophosphatase superfamily)